MTVREWLESIKGINKSLIIAEREYKIALAYKDVKNSDPRKTRLEKVRANKRAVENIIECIDDASLRMTLRLCYIDDLKWSQIAYMTDVSDKTARNRLKKAIAAIEPIFDDLAAKYNIDILGR